MPYILSPIILKNSPGEWNEGESYQVENIYKIIENKLPPVHYDKHILKPHSLTHVETPKHTQINGKGIDYYYQQSINHFYGQVIVIKLKNQNFKTIDEAKGLYHWIIQKEEILNRLNELNISQFNKIFITCENVNYNPNGYHDPKYILTLSQEAANFLISQKNFNLFGTSWKSTDFNPGSFERPIHNIIFSKALIVENLNLQCVPEGKYFLSCFPLPLEDAAESPVVPVLYTEEEIRL